MLLPRATISMHSLNENLFPHLTDFSPPQQVLLIELCIKCYNIAKFPKVILKVFMNKAFSLLLELSQVP